jgi:hypothetical protein
MTAVSDININIILLCFLCCLWRLLNGLQPTRLQGVIIQNMTIYIFTEMETLSRTENCVSVCLYSYWGLKRTRNVAKSRCKLVICLITLTERPLLCAVLRSSAFTYQCCCWFHCKYAPLIIVHLSQSAEPSGLRALCMWQQLANGNAYVLSVLVLVLLKAVPCLRSSVVAVSLRRSVFNPRPFYVGFVSGTVTVTVSFLRMPTFSALSLISPTLHIYSSIFLWRNSP